MGEKAVRPDSPNHERSLRMRDRVGTIPKGDPIKVARVIAAVARDPNPRLRYLVGRDARMQLWLKRLLPWKWHEKVVARFLKVD